jgi:hypothetical protein
MEEGNEWQKRKQERKKEKHFIPLSLGHEHAAQLD